MNYFVSTILIKDEKVEASRCIGYFENKDEAIEAIETNLGDMHEYTYNYAVIEELSSGLYPYDVEPIFFKWYSGSKGYEKCVRPKALKSKYAIGIG